MEGAPYRVITSPAEHLHTVSNRGVDTLVSTEEHNLANQLIRKSGIYLLGNAATKLIAVVLVPIYAFFVSASDLGLFDFIQTVAGLASIAFFAAAWEAIIRFTMAKDPTIPPAETIRATIVLGLLGCAGLVAASVITMLVIGARSDLVAMGATIACLSGLLNVWQYAARAMGRSKLFVTSGIVSAAVNLALVAILVCYLRWGVQALLISFSAGLVCALIVLETRLHLLRLRGWEWPRRSTLAAIVGFTWPLMLNLMGTFLLAGFGRILITITLGTESNGQFAFAMKVAVVVTAVGQVLSMASLEETVVRIGTDNLSHFYSAVISSGWALMLSGGSLTVFATWVMFQFLGDTEYAGSFVLVPVLVLWGALSVLTTNYGNIFQVANRTGIIAWTTLGGLAVAIVGSTLTVRLGGTLAVSIWMVAGMLITLIIRRHLTRRYVAFRENKSVILPVLAYASASAIGMAQAPVALAATLGGVVFIVSGVLFTIAIRDLRRIPDVEL